MQQLVLSTGGDDDMGTVLGLLQSAPATDLALKMDILKVSIVFCRNEFFLSYVTFVIISSLF